MPPVLSIPQHVKSQQEAAARAKQLRTAREQYQWKSVEGLPPVCAKIPPHEQPQVHETWLALSLGAECLKGATAAGLNLLRTVQAPGDELSVFTRLYHRFTGPVPPAWQEWATDEGFVASVVNGMTPEYLFRVDPRSAAIRDDSDVQDFLRRGQRLPSEVLPAGATLEKLYEDGRLFMINLRYWLRGAPARVEGSDVPTCPIVAFYVDAGTKELKVIAIQLTPSGPLFHAQMHSATLWLAAKLHVTRALTGVGLPRVHFLGIHFAGAGLVIAARRNLAPQHPVMAMLAPHIKNHLFSSESLKTAGQVTNPTAQHVVRVEWHRLTAQVGGATMYDAYHLPRSLARRGVDDAKSLPGYLFRDDGLLVWAAVAEYARAVVAAAYGSDEAVARDAEVQGWLAEAGDPARGEVTGLPECRTRAALADVLTWVVFHFSAYHSYGSTSGQHYYGCTLTNPITFNFDPPRTMKELRRCDPTVAELRAALPPLKTAFALTAGIAGVGGNWYGPLMKLDPAVLANVDGGDAGEAAVRDFKAALEEVDAFLKEVGPHRRPAGFDYWQPSKLATSVWT